MIVYRQVRANDLRGPPTGQPAISGRRRSLARAASNQAVSLRYDAGNSADGRRAWPNTTSPMIPVQYRTCRPPTSAYPVEPNYLVVSSTAAMPGSGASRNRIDQLGGGSSGAALRGADPEETGDGPPAPCRTAIPGSGALDADRSDFVHAGRSAGRRHAIEASRYPDRFSALVQIADAQRGTVPITTDLIVLATGSDPRGAIA